MKQTAVEWLIQAFDLTSEHPLIKDVLNKAKAMEKQQIMAAYKAGNHSETRGGKVIFEKMEQYYEQTYGGNNAE